MLVTTDAYTTPLYEHEPPRRVPLDPDARLQVQRDAAEREAHRTLGLPTWRDAEELRAVRAWNKEKTAVQRARRQDRAGRRWFA